MAKTEEPTMDTVFYSWQSDLDPKTNRYFIEDALEKAVKLLSREGIEVDRRIDQDARDCPGAADIAAELFRKIGACRVCVADVSIINAGARFPAPPKQFGEVQSGHVLLTPLLEAIEQRLDPTGSCRPTPNPNVLIELGYAANALTWDRVICVVNEAYGEVEKLPFDIRPRSMVKYSLLPTTGDEERKEKKEKLRDWLKDALKLALARNEEEIAAQKQREAEAARQRQAAEDVRRQKQEQLRMIAEWIRSGNEIAERIHVFPNIQDPPGVSAPPPQELTEEVERWTEQIRSGIKQTFPEFESRFMSNAGLMFSNTARVGKHHAFDLLLERIEHRVQRLIELDDRVSGVPSQRP
jgi:hypothetical protein